MKYVKMLGLAAVAAVAAMAFVGAGSASATTLCKVNTSPCPEASRYPVPSTVLALSTEAVLTGSLSVTCHSHVAVLSEKNDGVGAPLLGKFTALTWTSCKGGCSSATTTLLPLSASLQNLTLTAGKTEVELKGCLGIFTCKATATEPKLTFNGGAIGSTASAKASNVLVTLSGFGCAGAGDGSWNAGGGSGGTPYVITSINGSAAGSVFVVASP
jgi:hypothetical protein